MAIDSIGIDLLGKSVNLMLVEPSVMGATISGVVDSIVSATEANRHADVYALHNRIYPYLPNGTPDDPAKYGYVLLTTDTQTQVVGIPWINLPSSEVVESFYVFVDIPNGSQDVIERVRKALAAELVEGFTVYPSNKRR